MKIRFAVNPNHIGKVPDTLPQPVKDKIYYGINGGFKNFLEKPEVLIKHIQAGHPYTNQHRGIRREDRFIAAQIIGLDFDNGFAPDEFITQNAYFMHTTVSHTPENPRCRVIFVLSEPIYNPRAFRLLVEGMLDVYTDADGACKDPVRLFFGAPNCEVTIYGHYLDFKYASEKFVIPYQEKKEKERKEAEAKNRSRVKATPESVNGTLDKIKDDVVEKILASIDGEKRSTLYGQSFRLGGLIPKFITRNEAEIILEDAIAQRGNIKSMSIALKAIEQGIENGMKMPLDIYEDKKTFEDWGINL